MTYIEHLDDKFNFGKFAGCSFAEVVEYNPEYISWVVENVSGEICVFGDSVIEELKLLFPQFEISPDFEAMRNQRIAEYEDWEEGYNEDSVCLSATSICSPHDLTRGFAEISLAIIFGGSLPFEETASLLYVLGNFGLMSYAGESSQPLRVRRKP